MKKTARTALAAFALVGTIGLASCGGDSDTADTTMAPVPEVTVTGQWARTSPMATTMGAAYMTIETNVDDELVGAMVDASIAGMAEVHEMVPASEATDGESEMHSDTTMMGSDTTMASDAMVMQKVDKVSITAGTPLELKPGSYHIMLMKLVKPLETGTSFDVTLKFAKAGDVTVSVPVMEDAP